MYRVEYGWCCEHGVNFATFEEALTFLRGYSAAVKEGSHRGNYDLVCPDRVDGAEDAGIAAHHGLTREEWERVEEVG